MTALCICGHTAAQHDADDAILAIDWCNVPGCPCERFADQAQSDLFEDDEMEETELDDLLSDEGYGE